MTSFLHPKPYKDPRLIAAEVLRRSGAPRLSNGIAIDVESILRDYCRFDVAHVPNLDPGGKALLGLLVPEHNLVMIEHNCIETRKRFTMAHEIGHAELEYDFGNANSLFDLGQLEIFECTPDDENFAGMDERQAGQRRRREIRANQFAAHLLMPEGLVREIWQKYADPRRLADALYVSSEALGYRLQEMRLIF